MNLNSIVVAVQAHREKKGQVERDTVATAEFVFVSVQKDAVELVKKKPDLLPYGSHGLTLSDDEVL